MDLKIYKRRQLANRIGLTLSMSAMGLGLEPRADRTAPGRRLSG